MRRSRASAALIACALVAVAPAVGRGAPRPAACRSQYELAGRLDNPVSPRLIGGSLVFSQSGSGRVSRIGLAGGKPRTLISGFARDTFAGYRISAQGIAVDPTSGDWLVAAAEGAGALYRFSSQRFPMRASAGQRIGMPGATEDNPFGVAIRPPLVIVSSGTKAVYAGPLDTGDPPLRAILEVRSGVIGLTVDPRSGRVFAAVFGRGRGQGRVVSWEPSLERAQPRTLLTGLTNPVDLAFTTDGTLLVAEFGVPGAGGGRLSAVRPAADLRSGRVTRLAEGLANPSGVTAAGGAIYVTEFGLPRNGRRGRILVLKGCGVR